MAISFVSAGSNSQWRGGAVPFSLTPTVPAGYASGDVLLAFVWVYGSAGTTGDALSLSVPSGWDLLLENNFSLEVALWVVGKIATSSEATPTFTVSTPPATGGAYFADSVIVDYRGASLTLDATALETTPESGTVTTLGVNTSLAGDYVLSVALGLNSSNTITPLGSLSPRFNDTIICVADILRPSAGASGAQQFSMTGSAYSLTVALKQRTSAPAAPTLLSPANASYQDVASGIYLSAQYNSTDGAAQDAYALEIKTSGASSYSYFNASTNALQSTIVWNSDYVAPGADWSVSLAPGLLSDGNTYNWSMSSQEAEAGIQGAFASAFTFTAQLAPSVSVTAPSGTVTGTTEPVVSWSDTLPSGASQTGYEVVIESGSFGTTPGAGTGVWDSGVVSSSATSVAVGVALTTGVTYRAFVQITETGAEVSNWAYSTFTVQADQPALPVLTGVAGTDPATGAPMVTLTLNAQDNELTANQASLESNVTTGWTAGANTTIAASSTWAQDGSYSLALTATAAGAVSAASPTGTSGVACSPGQVVRAMASLHSPTTVRACTVAISFYNASGTLISTSTSTSVNSTLTGNGGQAFLTVTAPALSAFMSVTVNAASLGASEVIYVDCVLLGPGTSTTWSAGGFVGATTANFTFSDDGVNWFAVRNGTGVAIPASNQTVTLVDYEGSLGFTRQYQAQVVH